MFILLLHVFDSLMSCIMFFILILFVVLSIFLLFFEEFFDAMISFVPRSYYFVDFILLLFILCSQISFDRFILFLWFSVRALVAPRDVGWKKAVSCFSFAGALGTLGVFLGFL